MKGKKSALLYCDLIHTVEKLDDENAGKLFKHFLRYINDKDPEAENLLVEIAFEPIKQSLKRDLKTWENKQELRSRSGQIGNLKRYYPAIYQDFINKKITFEESQKLAKDSKASQQVAKLAVNGNGNVKGNKKIISIEERETEFKNSLRPFLDQYGKEMLNKFFDYWTEKKPKGRKMRFEMEKVFDVSKRLKTWDGRNKKFSTFKSNLKENGTTQHRKI